MDNYFKIKIKKMGVWVLRPADSECWHSEHTARYFKKHFGFGKGTLIIQTNTDGLQHSYFPEHYFKRQFSFIKKTNRRNYLAFEKIIKTFYPLRQKALQEVPRINPKNIRKISDMDLINIYRKNRDWVHRVTIYDQFGWTGGDYWNPVMEKILNKYGLKKGNQEYYRILFTLTKPEEISTTLREKRETLEQVIKIKNKRQTINKASVLLVKNFGWMPVFAFGTPWDGRYYEKQLRELLKRDLKGLKKDYESLKNYTKIRNIALKEVVRKYKINKKDLQSFIDFGLTLDCQNEAEYLVSLTGFYLLPIYKEISRRLYLSLNQIRTLYEDEIAAALAGKLKPQKVLAERKKICGWGFNREMTKRYNFTPSFAQKLFDHLNKTAANLHGQDEAKGLCANLGQKKGRAKILLTPADNNKVKEGDILIAHATTVDYLPAMKRAAAFVTEVGGLTCHAAVVAREFNVPAIVCLKNATKNFKDGEIVEVDADKGIVRKL